METPSQNNKVYGFLSGTELVWAKEQGKILGSGGFGTVYSYRTSANTTHAVKLINNRNEKGQLFITTDTLVEVSSLLVVPRHVNVITLFDIFITGDKFGLVLEEADDNLSRVLQRGILPNGTKLTLGIRKNISYQFLRGVSIITKSGLLNRDYKPSNILIKQTTDCLLRVIITDFGLSIDNNCYRDVSTKRLGTPLYMAPELAVGASPSYTSDLWSCYATIYAILTGSNLIRETKIREIIYEQFALFGADPTLEWPDITKFEDYRSGIGKELSKLAKYPTLEEKLDIDTTTEETKDFLFSIILLDPNDRPKIDDVLDDDYFSNVKQQIEENIPCLMVKNSNTEKDCKQLLEDREFYPLFNYDRKYENTLIRRSILDRLNKKVKDFNMTDRCRFLAITLADRHLARLETDKLQQVEELKKSVKILTKEQIVSPINKDTYSTAFGCSLLLACTFLDSSKHKFSVNDTKDFVTEVLVTDTQIYSTSIQILANIEFKLHNTTSYDILNSFSSNYDKTVMDVAIIYLILLYYDYRILTFEFPLTIAYFCLYLGTRYAKQDVLREHRLTKETLDENIGSLTTLIKKLWIKDGKLDISSLKQIRINNITASMVLVNTEEIISRLLIKP